MNELLLNKGSPSLLGHKVSGLKIIKGIQRGEAWEPLFSETYLGPRLCNQTDQSCIEYPGTLEAFSTAEKREEVARLRQGREAGTACRALCVWCFGYTPPARGDQ